MFERKTVISAVASLGVLIGAAFVLPKLPLRAPFVLLTAAQAEGVMKCAQNTQTLYQSRRTKIEVQLHDAGFTERQVDRLVGIIELQQKRFADDDDMPQRVASAFSRTEARGVACRRRRLVPGRRVQLGKNAAASWL